MLLIVMLCYYYNVFNLGFLFHSYNEDFKKYHKLSLGIMKQFGFGNRIMEKRIMEEIEPLLEKLAKFQGYFLMYLVNIVLM